MSDRSRVNTCEGHLLRGVELDRVDCEEDNREEIRTGHKPATSKHKWRETRLILPYYSCIITFTGVRR